MAPRFTNFQPGSTVVRIDRLDDPGIDLTTVEYLVTFGGAKDDVEAVIVARPRTGLRIAPHNAPTINRR